MTVAVLTGVPGVGATTVAERSLELLEDRQVEYEIVSFGTQMLETARDEGLVEDRDELRKLPSDQQKEIQAQAGERIAEMAEDTNVLVDTHCAIKTPEGYLPGLPEWVLEGLEPDTIALIETDPEEILFRRIDDETRDRDFERTGEIDTHQNMNRSAAMSYATLTGATVKIVKNPDGGVDEAAEELADTLE
ncbi:adenylate kinase [Halorutilales archaeon Cl-col2-1]